MSLSVKVVHSSGPVRPLWLGPVRPPSLGPVRPLYLGLVRPPSLGQGLIKPPYKYRHETFLPVWIPAAQQEMSHPFFMRKNQNRPQLVILLENIWHLHNLLSQLL